MKPNRSSSKTQIIIVAVLLGLGLLVLLVLLAYLFGGNFIQQLAAPATETQVFPTLFVPTTDCGSATLLLGTSTFQIQDLTPAADGSLTVPSDTSGIAYWVEATMTHPVFIISSHPENMTVMSTVTAGIPAKVTWKNCNSTSYNLSAGQAATLDIVGMSAQSTDGTTIFFQTDPSGAGFVFEGEFTEQQLSSINTPSPSEIQAEISLLETTAAPDGTSVRIGVSVQNFGASALNLTVNDVALTAADGMPLSLTLSEPALPREIATGAVETIYFTFARPSAPTATLKIFTVEYDIEGY
jgi:hypothetical protein